MDDFLQTVQPIIDVIVEFVTTSEWWVVGIAVLLLMIGLSYVASLLAGLKRILTQIVIPAVVLTGLILGGIFVWRNPEIFTNALYIIGGIVVVFMVVATVVKVMSAASKSRAETRKQRRKEEQVDRDRAARNARAQENRPEDNDDEYDAR